MSSAIRWSRWRAPKVPRSVLPSKPCMRPRRVPRSTSSPRIAVRCAMAAASNPNAVTFTPTCWSAKTSFAKKPCHARKAKTEFRQPLNTIAASAQTAIRFMAHVARRAEKHRVFADVDRKIANSLKRAKNENQVQVVLAATFGLFNA